MLSQNKISKAEAEPYIIIVNIKEKVLKIILSYIVCVGVSFGQSHRSPEATGSFCCLHLALVLTASNNVMYNTKGRIW